MHFYQGMLCTNKKLIQHTLLYYYYSFPHSLCAPTILVVNTELQRDGITYHTAEVAAHKDVVERGQLQVGGPQVPGQLQTFTVRHTAAPVRGTQWACTWWAFICTRRRDCKAKARPKYTSALPSCSLAIQPVLGILSSSHQLHQKCNKK